jgi:hypothetical protein
MARTSDFRLLSLRKIRIAIYPVPISLHPA